MLTKYGYLKIERIRRPDGTIERAEFTLLDPLALPDNIPSMGNQSVDHISDDRDDIDCSSTGGEGDNSKILKSINQNSISDEDSNSESSIALEGIIELYHKICISYPKVYNLTPKREDAVKAIVAKHGRDKIVEVFHKMESSSFLTGDNDRGWMASLDWVLVEDNFLKVVEGHYDNRVPPPKETSLGWGSIDMADIERLLRQSQHN